MKKLPYKASRLVTLGVELELQIIDPTTYDLISRAKGLLRIIQQSKYRDMIKPEITQSMIEINSSVHRRPHSLLKEYYEIQDFLLVQSKELGVHICGGGTHPFQKWSLQKIFPSLRFKNLSRQYRYLSKRSTVFGEHVHVGCPTKEDALYLTYALARYVPQLIAISASSPFYQGADTGYNTCRPNIFSVFPMSGVMPFFNDWQEFVDYYYKMRKLGIVESMKDFYWDIRPKPEYGTVEVRVCDTPLTINKTICIAAYIQALAQYLIIEKPNEFCTDVYLTYKYNRFQASRYGLEGDFINPYTLKHGLIRDDILSTFKKIEPYVEKLKTMDFIGQLYKDIKNKTNDAITLKQIFKRSNSLPDVVQKQCLMWAEKR